MRIRFLSPAETDYLEALKYYTSQSPGLGAAFLDELENTLDLLKEHPEIGRKRDEDHRQLMFRRFPYSVVYEASADQILVVAVAHHRQRPKSWKDQT